MEPPNCGNFSRTARRAANSSGEAAVKLFVPTPMAGSSSLLEGMGLRTSGRGCSASAGSGRPRAHPRPAARLEPRTVRRETFETGYLGDLTSDLQLTHRAAAAGYRLVRPLIRKSGLRARHVVHNSFPAFLRKRSA